MAKQPKDIETELDEVREQKQAIVNVKKMLETEYKDLKATMDIHNKVKEDVLKQLKKLQQAMKEQLIERARKNQIRIEQLKTELASERGNAHKMEHSEMMLEKQNEVKLEQVKKIDNGVQKGLKKKVERGPKIEELREEQDTHRNSIDDQNKDLYELKKKKAKLQGEKNNENRNDSLERMKRDEVTKAHLKGPKKDLADIEGLSGSYNSSGSSGKKMKKSQTEVESGRLKDREVVQVIRYGSLGILCYV